MQLAKRWEEYNNNGSTQGLEANNLFVELLCNASWSVFPVLKFLRSSLRRHYLHAAFVFLLSTRFRHSLRVDLIHRYLYEMSDYDLGNELIMIAKSACQDKDSHLYLRLCNTHGSNYSELNMTNDMRKEFMQALEIREKLQDELYHGDIAIAYLNMGNAETATRHYDEAMEFYQRAMDIYPSTGDTAAWKLALVYMGMGRCHAARAQFQDARMRYGQAEQLFVRTKGSDKHFMAQ